MEPQEPTTTQLAASIFFKNCQQVPFKEGFIKIQLEKIPNGTAPVTFSFSDWEIEEHYQNYLRRIVGDRDHIIFENSKMSSAQLCQISDFLRRYLTNTLYSRRTVFITKEIFNVLKKYPYKSQDGLSLKAKVIARYFNEAGSGTWYVTELADIQYPNQNFQEYTKEIKKLKLEDLQNLNFFGVAELGFDFEWGSFSMNELSELLLLHDCEIRRDTSIEPLKYTLEECFNMYNEKMM